MNEKKRLQLFVLLVSAFLLGAANGIAMCKFCWPVRKWVMGGIS